MTRGQKAPLPPGVLPAWSHVEGRGASRVVAYEDLARARQITLRWRVGSNWRRKTLGLTLERDRRGNITKASEGAAKDAATLKSAALIKGTPEEKALAPGRFTIGETRSALIDPDAGPYPHPTPFRAELLRALDFAGTVWGEGTPWATITDADWTKLIRRRLAGLLQRQKQGVRTTEVTVSRINTAAEYLRDNARIPRDAARLPKKWRKTLIESWRGQVKEITGVVPNDPTPSRPRHTLDEMRKILAAAPQVDPRFGLLMQLAAEYRAGQAIRAKRSHLDVDAGTFTIHGRGKKLGALIDLTPGQLAYVREVLSVGYLAELEGEYQADGADYYLFPAGKVLGKGTADARLSTGMDLTKPVERQWVVDNFHAAEDVAKVPRVKGRAQYGTRRQNVDAMNAEGISPLGKQAAGGWSSTDVPDAIYAESTNKVGREEAARVRAKTRGEA
jgi:integrase